MVTEWLTILITDGAWDSHSALDFLPAQHGGMEAIGDAEGIILLIMVIMDMAVTMVMAAIM